MYLFVFFNLPLDAFYHLQAYFTEICGIVDTLCIYSCIPNKISNDMLLDHWGKSAGSQEEFQIFDKHVKAVKPGLVIMPILLLLLSM